jgi:hypothetical protein
MAEQHALELQAAHAVDILGHDATDSTTSVAR